MDNLPRDYDAMAFFWKEKERVTQGMSPEEVSLEPLFDFPEWAYHYAREVVKGRVPELEVTISDDPFVSHFYSKKLIGGRSPLFDITFSTRTPWRAEYVSMIESISSKLYPRIILEMLNE